MNLIIVSLIINESCFLILQKIEYSSFDSILLLLFLLIKFVTIKLIKGKISQIYMLNIVKSFSKES